MIFFPFFSLIYIYIYIPKFVVLVLPGRVDNSRPRWKDEGARRGGWTGQSKGKAAEVAKKKAQLLAERKLADMEAKLGET